MAAFQRAQNTGAASERPRVALMRLATTGEICFDLSGILTLRDLLLQESGCLVFLFGLYLVAHVCIKIIFVLMVLTHLTVPTAP